MHHKRSKMKPEEELPSPGVVSIQVGVTRTNCKHQNQLSFTDSIGIFHLYENSTHSGEKRKQITAKSHQLDFIFRPPPPIQQAHIAAGHLPTWLQQQASLTATVQCLFTCIWLIFPFFPSNQFQFPKQNYSLIFGTLVGNCFCFGLI